MTTTFLIRLPQEELDALRRAAEEQHRSMNEVAREAIRGVVTGATREEHVRALVRGIMHEDAEILERLANM
jgi:hypothetical protein